MTIREHLTSSMNTEAIQTAIACASLRRDLGLIELEDALKRHGQTEIGVAFLDIDKVEGLKPFGPAAKGELIDVVGERLRVTTRDNEQVLWMGNDEYIVLCEAQDGYSRIAQIVKVATGEAISLERASELGPISVTLRVAFDVVEATRMQAPDLYVRGAAASRRAKAIGAGSIVNLNEDIEIVGPFQVPQSLLSAVKLLCFDQEREIDAVAVEALELLLRRYHR